MANPEITDGNSIAVFSTSNPTAADSSYVLYYMWVNTTAGSEGLFMITDNTPDAAIWKRMGMSSNRTYSLSGIDGKSTGQTTIFTTESTWGDFYITDVVFIATSLSALITPSTVSVGANGSANDVITAAILTGLSSATLFHPLSILANPVFVPASTAVKVNVTLGAIATTYTLKAVVTGFYA